ncbi:MAG: LLM class flavin-dependent oxidoreductase, partial [Actinobacteria bacterium]|nr:LLM class flavin-dependent oxidoreductase [Actinomycetota bacterium]
SKSIAGPFVTHHDAYHNLQEVPINPRLHQQPGQSVWVTVMSPDSAAWCAERGWKMCTAWSPMPVVEALASRYWEAGEAAGRPVNSSMLGLRRRVFVADSDEEAREKYEAATDVIGALAGRGFETRDPRILEFMMQPDDFVIGSPETVAEQLIEQCRAGGFGVVMAFPDFALFSPEDLARSHELLGTRVGPILHSADVARPSQAREGGARKWSPWEGHAASSRP